MVAAELGEALIESDREQVPVVGVSDQRSVEVGLYVDGGAHAAESEVPVPEVGDGQPGVSASLLEHVDRLSHGGRSWAWTALCAGRGDDLGRVL